MRIQLTLLVALLSICFQPAFAQPSHYNGNSAVMAQGVPFFQNPVTGSNKVQWLMYNSFFPFAASGNITAIYLRTDRIAGSSHTITGLSVSMKQVDYGSFEVSLTPPDFETGLTNVYSATSTPVTVLPGGWIKIPLQTNFPYSKNRNFVIEVSAQAQVNINLMQADNGSFYSRLFRNYNGTGLLSGDYSIPDLGFDLDVPPLQKLANNVTISGLYTPTNNFCMTMQPLALRVNNMGANRVSSLKIGWLLDGVQQTDINYLGLIDTFSGAAGNPHTLVVNNMANLNFLNVTQHKLKFYTYLPNGSADAVPANDTLELTLNAIAPVKLTTPDPVNICKQDPVSVTMTPSPNGTLYLWSQDNVLVQISHSPTPYTATAFGTYEVKATIGGCSTTAVIIVDSVVVPEPIISPALPIICGADKITLKAPNLPGATNQWELFGNPIAGATADTLTTVLQGTYILRRTKLACSTTSAPINVLVRPKPAAVITATDRVLYTDTTDILSYQWYITTAVIPTPVAIPGATSYTYKPTQKGYYTVTVSNKWCTETSQQYIVDDAFLSVNNVYGQAAVYIYPNPAHDQLHIDAPAGSRVSITGMDGRVLVDEPVKQSTVDMSHLAEGLYIIRINDTEGKLLRTEKLTKLQ